MQRIARVFVLVLFLIAGTVSAQASIWYVSENGDNSDSGMDWGNAWATIQYALGEIEAGDTVYVNGEAGNNNYLNYCLINKNDVVIEGVDAGGGSGKPVLSWDSGNYNGFDIRGDNVKIRNFVIQNFRANLYATNFPTDGGAGVYVFNEKSGLVLDGVEIDNCTWGVYVDDAAIITVKNSDIDGTNVDGSIEPGGGVGIMIWSDDATDMDAMYIGTDANLTEDVGNTINNCPINGIQFGSDAANINAEGSYIWYNVITNCGNSASNDYEGYGMAIWNLTGSVEIAYNTVGEALTGPDQNRGLYLSCMDYDVSNNDVFVTANTFYITEPIIILADENFSGEMLYEIWAVNDNSFGGSIKHSAAALEGDIDEVVNSRQHPDHARIIRYWIQDAIFDAYDNDRVKVAEGHYEECLDVDVSVDIFSWTDDPWKHIIYCEETWSSSSSTISPWENATNTPQHELFADSIKFHGFEFTSFEAQSRIHMMGLYGKGIEIFNDFFRVPEASSADICAGIVNIRENNYADPSEFYNSGQFDDNLDGTQIHDNWFFGKTDGGRGYDGIDLRSSSTFSGLGDVVSISSNSFTQDIHIGIWDERSDVDIVGNTIRTNGGYQLGDLDGSYDAGDPWTGIFVANSSTFDNIDNVLIDCNNITGDEYFGFERGIALGDASDTFSDVQLNSNWIDDAYIALVNYAYSNTITINWHDFSGNYTSGIALDNNNAQTLDVTYNWWDSENGPDHPDNTFNPTLQGYEIEGALVFSPWLASFNDEGECPYTENQEVFQGPVFLYNADESILRGIFPSIQAAIDDPQVESGDHIVVIEGSYVEQVNVYKEVYLRGKKPGPEGYGIPDGTADAWTGGTAGTGSGPELQYDGAGDMLYIADDNVTIRGFNFDMVSNANKGIQFTGNLNNSTIEYCSFDMDDGDIAIEGNLGNGVDGLDMNYNTFVTGSSSTFFSIVPSASAFSNVDFEHNDVDGNSVAAINIGDNNFIGFDFAYNDLEDGGITVGAPNSATGLFGDFLIQHNTFNDGESDEPALYILASVDDCTNLQDGSFATDFVFWYNQVLETGAVPAVGFEDAENSIDCGNWYIDFMDARFNWWTSENGPEVMHDMGVYDYDELEGNSYWYTMQGSMVTPGVEFVRWYLEPALTNLYGPIWNDDNPTEYFADIQRAVWFTDDDGVVTLDDGSFTIVDPVEVIDYEGLTIRGQGYENSTEISGWANNGWSLDYYGSLYTPMFFIGDCYDVTVKDLLFDMGDNRVDFDFNIGIYGVGNYRLNITKNMFLYDEDAEPYAGYQKHIDLEYYNEDVEITKNIFESAIPNIGVYMEDIEQVEINGNTFTPFSVADGGLGWSHGLGIFGYHSDIADVDISENDFLEPDEPQFELDGHYSEGQPPFFYTGAITFALDEDEASYAMDDIEIFCNSMSWTIYGVTLWDDLDGPSSTFTDIDITQNLFESQSFTGVYIADDDEENSFGEMRINENNFMTSNSSDTFLAIYVEPNSMIDDLNATNNYYDDELGPKNDGNTWGAPANEHLGMPVDFTNNSAHFVPFWTEIEGTVCNYTGTSLAPIVRTDQQEPVGATLEEYFASIQSAIDDNETVNGKFIWVMAGSYYESNIQVDKELGIIGKKVDGFTSAWMPGEPGSMNGPILPWWDSHTGLYFDVDYDDVSIKGFTFDDEGSTNEWDGIELLGNNNTLVAYNTFNSADGWQIDFDYYNYSASFTYNHFISNSNATAVFEANDYSYDTYIGQNLFDNMDVEFSWSHTNTYIFENEFNNATLSFWYGLFDDILIEHNSFVSDVNNWAIYFSSNMSDADVEDSFADDFVIRYNSFDIPVGDHPAVGFYSFSSSAPSTDITAECNWWGSVDGPTHIDNTKVGNQGTEVSDGVDYLPWLNDGTDLFPNQVGWQNTSPCTGANVYTSIYDTWGEPVIGYYASIQAAIDNLTTDNADYVHIHDGSYDEDLTIDVDLGFVSDNTTDDIVYLIGSDIDLIGSSSATLFTDFWILGDFTFGANSGDVDNWFWLSDYNFWYGGSATDMNGGVGNNSFITNGTGYLKKFNAVHDQTYSFLISSATEFLKTDVIIGNDLYNDGIFSIRVNDVNPADAHMGERDYAINHTWFMRASDMYGGDLDFDLEAELTFWGIDNWSAGSEFDKDVAYGARWNDDNGLWDSYFTNSDPVSNNLEVDEINYFDLEWGIFSGTSAFALSDNPTPARLILFRTPQHPDTELRFRWINGDGTGVAVVAEKADTINADDYPIDGDYYSSVTDNYTQNWGDANHVALTGGSYVVYKQDDQSYLDKEMVLKDLDPGTEYTIGVFSYNGVDGLTNYNTYIDDVNPTLDPARRNPRSRSTYPRARMWIEGGVEGVCSYSAPVDDCQIICDGESIDKIFTMEGGDQSGNMVFVWSELGISYQHSASSPSSTLTQYPNSTRLYKLIRARDASGVLAVIDQNYDQARVVVHFPPETEIASAYTNVCENSGSFTLVGTITAGDPLPTLDHWVWWNGTSWQTLNTDGTNAFTGAADGKNTATPSSNMLSFTNLDFATFGNGNGTVEFKAVYVNNAYCDPPGYGNEFQTINSVTVNVDKAPVAGNWDNRTIDFCEDDDIVLSVDNDNWFEDPYLSSATWTWEYNDGSGWQEVDFGTLTDGNTVLTINSGQLSYDGYKFRVVYYNGECDTYAEAAFTSEIEISVDQLPEVTFGNPGDEEFCDEDDVTIWVTSDISATITWYHNDAEYDDPTIGTSSTITFGALEGDEWYATIVNGECLVTTDTYTVQGAPAPDFTSNLTGDQTVCENTDSPRATFTTSIDNSTNETWYAYLDGQVYEIGDGSLPSHQYSISGTSELEMWDLDIDWDGAAIWVEADNGICSRWSNTVNLYVKDAPVVVNWSPNSSTVCEGYDIEFQASVSPGTGTNCDPLDQSWWTNAGGTHQLPDYPGGVDATTGATITYLFTNRSDAIEAAGLNPELWHLADVWSEFDCSPCSTEVSNNFETYIRTQPEAPGNPTATLRTGMENSALSLSWDAVDGVNVAGDGYEVKIFESDGPAVTDWIDAGNNTSYDLPECTLDPNTEYYFEVRGYLNCRLDEYLAGEVATSANITTNNPQIVPDTYDMGHFGIVEIAQESATKSQAITFTNLNYDIQIEVPVSYSGQAEFYVSTDNSTWTSNTSRYLSYSGGSPFTLYVKFVPRHEEEDISVNIAVREDIPNNCYDEPIAYITVTGTGIPAPPTLQATDIVFTEDNTNSFDFTWDWRTDDDPFDVDAEGAIIVLKQATYPCTEWSWTPSDNTNYVALGANDVDSDGEGDLDGYVDGDYIVVGDVSKSYYDANFASNGLEVVGLAANTNYIVHIFSYTGSGTTKNYNTDSECPDLNPNGLFYLAFTTGPHSLRKSGKTFNDMVVTRYDRADNEYTPTSAASVTLTPIDVDTHNDVTDDVDVSGSVSGNNEDIQSGDASVTFGDFVWTSDDDNQGRAFNELLAEAYGYMDGISETVYTDPDGTDHDGFVLRAQQPSRQARWVIFIGNECDNGEARLRFSWRKGLGGNRWLAVMRRGNAPNLPVDGKWYDPAAAVDQGTYWGIPYADCDPVEGTNSRAVYNGTDDELPTDTFVDGLVPDAYYYVKVTEFNHSAGLSGAARAATVNYYSALGTNNPNSVESANCRISVGGVYVELEKFEAKSFERKAYLEWVTTFEQGIVGYELYRADMTNTPEDQVEAEYKKVGGFQSADELVALGGIDNRYSFVDDDEMLVVGNEYMYKLVAIGIDGQRIKLAERPLVILSMTSEAGNLSISNLRPVPATDYVDFDLEMANDADITVEVIDLSGRSVALPIDKEAFKAGSHNIKVEFGDVTSGTYLLTISTGNEYIIQKFVVTK